MSKDKPASGTSQDATPAPATAPAVASAPDKNHGRGGMYTNVNGERQRVSGTKAAHETKKG